MSVGEMTLEDIVKELEEGEIFVFGSNAMGHHGGGAAYAAMKKFGAIYGQGDGLQGQSYAISTMEGLVNTARNINRFIDFASGHQDCVLRSSVWSVSSMMPSSPH